MWFLLAVACPSSSTSQPEPGDAPLIPVAAPTPPPEPPPGPLPKIGAADKLVVEFASEDVDGGPVGLACAVGGVTSACSQAFGGKVWAVDVSPLSDDPARNDPVVIRAHEATTVAEQGPQCGWLRVHPIEGSHPAAAPPRPIHAVTELPAALQAAPPHRAWSVDLDGDGVDEVLYEQAEHGATNTIGVVKADGTKVVIWQDEAPGPAGGPAEDGGEPVGSMGASWATLVGLTDTTLDGKLEIVLDLDRHETFGWTVFSYTPAAAAQVATANCKVATGAPR